MSALAVACEQVQPAQETETTKPKTNNAMTAEQIEAMRPKVDTTILLTPREVFTGYDAARSFVFPIALEGASDDSAVLTASDPSALEIRKGKLAEPDEDEPDTSRYYLVTVKKPGDFTLTVTWQGKSASATVYATTYAASRFAAGERRYKQGAGDGQARACNSCHNDDDGAPDHSPASLAGVDDTRVRETITSGILANGTNIMDYFGIDHRWTASSTELDGLVTYLRALPQKKVVLQ